MSRIPDRFRILSLYFWRLAQHKIIPLCDISMFVSNLSRVVTWQCIRQEFNPQPIDPESDTLAITPLSLYFYLIVVTELTES